MQLENKTSKDFLVGFTSTGTPITMFPDGDVTPSDMPAMLALGVDYSASEDLKLSFGANYYFDKTADYGHKIDNDLNSSTPSVFVKNKDIIKHNGWSVSAGAEMSLSEKLLVSGGYSFANKGVNDKYQSDLTFGLATHTLGAGIGFKLMDNLLLNAGANYTFYMKDRKELNHVFAPTGIIFQPDETYLKNTLLIGVGIDYSF
jgi:long-subunit fatty acid transport protein